MKTTLDLRPVYDRREDRIRAHVLLGWLSLLLIRVAETATGETWRTLHWELDKLHPDGRPNDARRRSRCARGWRAAVGTGSMAVLTVNMGKSSDSRRAPGTQVTDFGSGA